MMSCMCSRSARGCVICDGRWAVRKKQRSGEKGRERKDEKRKRKGKNEKWRKESEENKKGVKKKM